MQKMDFNVHMLRAVTALWISMLAFFIFIPASFSEYVGMPGVSRSHPNQEAVPGQLIVKFRPGVVVRSEAGTFEITDESLKELSRQYGVLSLAPVFQNAAAGSDLSRVFRISFRRDVNLAQAQIDFSANASVEYAEPNRIYHTQTSAGDTGPV